MVWTVSGRSDFGMTAVDRNRSGNVVRREIINVDSEFLVVSAMNVEIADQAIPNVRAMANRRNKPIGWTREKNRNGGRRSVFLIQRPAMLRTSLTNSPALITSPSGGELP